MIDLLRNPAPVSLWHSNVGLLKIWIVGKGEIFHGDAHGRSLGFYCLYSKVSIKRPDLKFSKKSL